MLEEERAVAIVRRAQVEPVFVAPVLHAALAEGELRLEITRGRAALLQSFRFLHQRDAFVGALVLQPEEVLKRRNSERLAAIAPHGCERSVKIK